MVKISQNFVAFSEYMNFKKWVSPQCVGSIFCALKGLWMDCCRFYGHTKLLFDQQTNFKPLAIWGNLIWCWVGKKSHEVQSDTLCDPINSTDPTKLATFNDYKHHWILCIACSLIKKCWNLTFKMSNIIRIFIDLFFNWE